MWVLVGSNAYFWKGWTWSEVLSLNFTELNISNFILEAGLNIVANSSNATGNWTASVGTGITPAQSIQQGYLKVPINDSFVVVNESLGRPMVMSIPTTASSFIPTDTTSVPI